MNPSKTIIVAIAAMLLLWLSAWLFNHFNPYAGLFLALATFIVVIIYLIKQNDQKH